MRFDAFIGGSNPSISPNIDIEHTFNLYLEAGAENPTTSSPKNRNALLGKPGLQLLGTLPTSPVRGLWSNATRLFCVAGSKLYEIFQQSGKVDVSGTTVTLTSGSEFDTTYGVAGNTITISGVQYTVASYTSVVQLQLTSSAGIEVNAQFLCVTWNQRGDVGSDGFPVDLIPNGNQLLIASNGTAYCDNGSGPVVVSFAVPSTGTVMITDVVGHLSVVHWVTGDYFSATMAGQTITIDGTAYTVGTYVNSTTMILTTSPGGTVDPVSYSCTPTLSARRGTFIDGYFVVSQTGSKQFNISAINDGTTWDPTDFGSKEGYPDNLQAVLADHEELWLFGTDTTEVWQDTGAALFPFERIPGAFIHHGCVAMYSPIRLREGVAWLCSEPNRGGITAVYAQGFLPQRISTHAIEHVWAGYASVSDCISWTYIENGHEFWVLQFPIAGATWVWDATSGTWSERGYSTNSPQLQAYHAYFAGMSVVGDYSTGNLYWQSVNFATDNGTPISWFRTAPHLTTEAIWNFYSKFQIDVQVGQSTSLPTISLSWSDDGGHTFSLPVATTPSDSTYAGRVIWWRLGRSRDRVFTVSGSTSASGPPVALINAYLDVATGIG